MLSCIGIECWISLLQAAVKEERREARRAKKELKGLFKGEAHHAQKVAAFTGPSSIHLM